MTCQQLAPAHDFTVGAKEQEARTKEMTASCVGDMTG